MEEQKVQRLNPKQFAEFLKSQYPGAFDDVKDDYLLTQAYLMDNPDDSDLVDFGPQAVKESDELNVIDFLLSRQTGGALSGAKVLQGVSEGGRRLAEAFKQTGKDFQNELGVPGAEMAGKIAGAITPQTPLEVGLTAVTGPGEGKLPTEAAKEISKKVIPSKIAKGIGKSLDINPVHAQVAMDKNIFGLTKEGADALYAKAAAPEGLPALKHIDRSVKEQFGVSAVKDVGTYKKLIDRAETGLETGLVEIGKKDSRAFTPQDAHDGLLAINRLLESTGGRAASKPLMELKENLIKSLAESGYTEIPAAQKMWADMISAGKFKSWLPNDWSRTVAMASGALASGEILRRSKTTKGKALGVAGLAGSAAMSPAAVKLGIILGKKIAEQAGVAAPITIAAINAMLTGKKPNEPKGPVQK